MNKLFTLKTLFRLASMLNHNKLDFDTRFTEDEWMVCQKDSLMDNLCLSSSLFGKFYFKRVRDTQEYCLNGFECMTKATRTFDLLVSIVEELVDDPELLDELAKPYR